MLEIPRLQHRCFPVKLAKFLRASIFKNICGRLLLYVILLEKVRAAFHIYIKFELNVKKTGWKKIRFQLTLNKTFCPTPPPLIHRRFKHRQRTKINKNNAFCLPLIGFPHKAHNISIENQVNIPS